MKKVSSCILLVLCSFTGFAQDTLAMPSKPVFTDVIYTGGTTDDLHNYINNNFNYNNVKKTDVPKTNKKQSFFVFYVSFTINEEGVPFDFSLEDIAKDNSFYIEAVRVIASTRWQFATENGAYKKQYVVIPVKASTNEL